MSGKISFDDFLSNFITFEFLFFFFFRIWANSNVIKLPFQKISKVNYFEKNPKNVVNSEPTVVGIDQVDFT